MFDGAKQNFVKNHAQYLKQSGICAGFLLLMNYF